LNASEHKLGPQDRNSLTYFSQTAKEGDIILCLASQTEICAMGVVTGSYFYQEDVPQGVREDYQHVLPVNWLLKDIRYDIRKQNGDCMLRPKTMYPLRRIVASDLLNDLRDVGFNLAESQKTAPAPHVLIIDEINRGNISRIFSNSSP